MIIGVSLRDEQMALTWRRSGGGHPPSGTGQETVPVDFAALWSDLATKLLVALHVTDAGRELWGTHLLCRKTGLDADTVSLPGTSTRLGESI